MKTSMAPTITRRLFLVLPVASLLLPRLGAADGPIRKTFSYQADIGVLFDLLTFHVTGVMTEEINFAAGRYRVVVTGEGLGITQRTEASGMIRAGRFVPPGKTLLASPAMRTFSRLQWWRRQ